MKILMELWTGIGPLIRSLPVARVLRDRGHEIQFVSHDQSAKYMLANGFRQADLDPSSVAVQHFEFADWRSVDWLGARRGFADPVWLDRTQAVWGKFLKREKFDLIVSDFGVQSSLAARCMGIPLVTITQSCMHPGRAGGRIWYWDTEREEDFSRSACIGLNAWLETRGLAPLKSFDELYLADKTMIPGLPEFDWLEQEARAKTLYTGPILWEGLYADDQLYLQQTESANKFATASGVRVFAYTGRMHDAAGNSGRLILEALLDTAQKRRNIQFTISSGGLDLHAGHFSTPLPANVRLVDWLPVAEAFGNSDLVIHHGGHGSCMANIIFGKPALVLPTHTERNFNAHRMQDLHLGSLVSRDQINSDNILKGIDLLLEDRRYLSSVREFQQQVKDNYSHSAEKAADLIEA